MASSSSNADAGIMADTGFYANLSIALEVENPSRGTLFRYGNGTPTNIFADAMFAVLRRNESQWNLYKYSNAHEKVKLIAYNVRQFFHCDDVNRETLLKELLRYAALHRSKMTLFQALKRSDGTKTMEDITDEMVEGSEPYKKIMQRYELDADTVRRCQELRRFTALSRAKAEMLQSLKQNQQSSNCTITIDDIPDEMAEKSGLFKCLMKQYERDTDIEEHGAQASQLEDVNLPLDAMDHTNDLGVIPEPLIAIKDVPRQENIDRIFRSNNHYEVLQVGINATAEEIRAQFYKVSLLVHPDKCGAALATEAMKVVNCAYAVLSDPLEKLRYDAQQQLEDEP